MRVKVEGMVLTAIKKKTDAGQAKASDPLASAWVSANAGTGKTYVLVQRVLRILLSGTTPERILCLTFTKAAASEMANRLYKKLGQWTILADDALLSELSKLLGRNPSNTEIILARRLFAKALETPGGLKVQTIHAFCEKLLQRFPIESGIAPHFAVLDEEAEKDLKRQAIDKALTRAVSSTSDPLNRALKSIIGFAGEDRFEDVLREALGDRIRLKQAVNFQFADDAEPDSYLNFLKLNLGLSGDISENGLTDELAFVLNDSEISEAVSILLTGKPTDCGIAKNLQGATNAPTVRSRVEALSKTFLTQDKKPRSDKGFVTKAIREEYPDLANRLRESRDRFYYLTQQLNALQLAKASAALVQFADVVMQLYENSKASRSVLDFDDLIIKAGNLLEDSEASAWVLYKLDGGIDHILVDEAQDTNPEAWKVISSLTDEFFSGSGSRDSNRTVFAVGDEKQSIYSFQGADPRKFADMGALFRRKAEQSRRDWHRIPLNLSFRSSSSILQVVDLIFQSERLASSVSAEREPVQHFWFREGQAGLVEIWETEKYDEQKTGDPWAPLSDGQEEEPQVRLANRIAGQIGYWLGNKTVLEPRGRPIRPGDILILLRKREPFAPLMIKALKDREIAVAGADRIRITEQLAVMDLMALGDFLLMPEDDLALATVLKSPLIDLNEEDLFTLAYDRSGSLWESVRRHAGNTKKFSEAYETLTFFLSRADLMPPFEFYAALLDWNDRRGNFVSRLGPEAGDALDEFLNMALRFDEASPPSLQGFLDWLRLSGTEIKRDMEQERNEVRVMTVHGAKGLESEIVFMPDTCSTRGAQQSEAVLPISIKNDSVSERGGLIWAIPLAKGLESVRQARGERRERERDEYYRLLYVAMTRAKDRLYITGFEGRKGRDEGCWYDTVLDNLGSLVRPAESYDGQSVLRLQSEQVAEPDQRDEKLATAETPLQPPAWANEKAPRETMATIPVAPSKIMPLDEDDEGGLEQTILPPRELASKSRFLRGRLTHALLEHLPSIEPDNWQSAAETLVSHRASMLPKAVCKDIVAETLAILRHPEFHELFGPESVGEVPISAKLTIGDDVTTPLHITGQIDRLVNLKDEIHIVDYKTNRPPPHEIEDVARAYILQLAAYRLVIKELYPEKQVKCSLLWTDGPRIMAIADDILDTFTAQLPALTARRT